MQAHNTLKFPQSEKKIDKPCNNFDYQSSFCFFFFSMVLTESVKSAKLTLLAMTLWSSAMLFLFIMVLKQKKDSILLRMKKITVTETFLGCLKRNSSWSILSQQDTAERNIYCQTKILKHGLWDCLKRLQWITVCGKINRCEAVFIVLLEKSTCERWGRFDGKV